MTVSRLTLLLLCLCLFQVARSQQTLSRVTFPIDETQTLRDLARAGIDLTHGSGSLRHAFTTELQGFELKRLQAQGIRFSVDIPDMARYRNQPHPAHRDGNFLDCQDHTFDQAVPKNFELGDKGGFFSLPEVLDNLDAMAIQYPGLISIRRPIGTYKTWQNNSIFWARISDHPELDENEPELLYTGLHHARELISVSQMIYYMWYLLENYDKDPTIRQIINNTELYFVPVVNPDGMNYNIDGYDPVEKIFTRNLRKNMRDNDSDGSFDPEIDGVDLNRNYGHEWGFDDEGSSGFMGSDTYRGPAPFSEPETQALQFFCNAHDFKIALNHHSYGNLLVFPWGYNDQSTPDSVIFSNYGDILTERNGFVYGRGTETVGYMTNGDSDDWMYGEANILSMTPEVGEQEDGFYPPVDRIIPLCQSTLEMNLYAARLINSLVKITDESPNFIHSGVNPLDLEFNRYGLLDGEVVISFNPLSPHITQVPPPIELNLNKFQPHQRNLSFTIDDQVAYGTSVQLEIICEQGQYAFRDTLTKIRADFSTLVDDEGDMSHWDISHGEHWGTTPDSYKSGPVSITDSPAGNYLPNANESIVLVQSVDLHKATSAYAQFWAHWDIEEQYDYVVFQASTDGESWENLCGEQSRLGSIFQLYEEPLYDGKQAHWVFENTDLTSFIGQTIQLRFLLVSDGFVHKDGFYFDDFKVIVIDEENVATEETDQDGIAVFPNPASDRFTIRTPQLVDPTLIVYDGLGQVMYTAKGDGAAGFTVNASSWPAGLYAYAILSGNKMICHHSISIAR